MKILLGVDDSTFAPNLVQAIAAQFRADDTDVMVLHVLQPAGPPPPQMGPGYAPELAEDNKLAQELVQPPACHEALHQAARVAAGQRDSDRNPAVTRHLKHQLIPATQSIQRCRHRS